MIRIEHLARSFKVPPAPGKSLPFKRAAAALVQAVRDVNLLAPNGQITGLLGPNGAGKTTTLRMLAGLIKPDAGRMTVDEVDVAREPLVALSRLGVLSDSRGLYPRLTARENIVYYGALQGMTRDAAQARAESLARMLDMSALLERTGKTDFEEAFVQLAFVPVDLTAVGVAA